MRRRVPDISKIGAAIGWTPTHLLPKILDDMIAYERKRLDLMFLDLTPHWPARRLAGTIDKS